MEIAQSPDPMADPDGYALWQELHACTLCEGLGEDFHEDEFDPDSGEYGKPWVCGRCGGTGVEPNVGWDDDPNEWYFDE